MKKFEHRRDILYGLINYKNWRYSCIFFYRGDGKVGKGGGGGKVGKGGGGGGGETTLSPVITVFCFPISPFFSSSLFSFKTAFDKFRPLKDHGRLSWWWDKGIFALLI